MNDFGTLSFMNDFEYFGLQEKLSIPTEVEGTMVL
jgi:hypothetical protein